jgi:hypothetical protein
LSTLFVASADFAWISVYEFAGKRFVETAFRTDGSDSPVESVYVGIDSPSEFLHAIRETKQNMAQEIRMSH